MRWSGIDATVLPTSQSARVVSDNVARDFPPSGASNQMLVVASGLASARPRVASYAAVLAAVPGVTRVSTPVRLAPRTWEITLAGPDEPISAAGQRVLSAVRAVRAPVPVLVGGQAADFADQGASIGATLPLAITILVLVTLIVLWLMTGSVVLPVKALLMNALTAAAATGVLVFIFQDGRLTGPLAYTSQGGIEETDFLILAAIAFALSTDYGVFLLARISEARQPGVPESDAIAAGMQRTGRLITAAAILLAVAIGVRHLQPGLPQGSRRRRRRCRAHRRLHSPGPARAVPDGTARPPQLVGTRLAGTPAPAPSLHGTGDMQARGRPTTGHHQEL